MIRTVKGVMAHCPPTPHDNGRLTKNINIKRGLVTEKPRADEGMVPGCTKQSLGFKKLVGTLKFHRC